jgi:hypothetical protein
LRARSTSQPIKNFPSVANSWDTSNLDYVKEFRLVQFKAAILIPRPRVLQSAASFSEAEALAHDVFISYSSKDKTIADAVCARLEARGIRCWIAPRDVQPGQPYGEEIIDAIHGSRAMVLVFSSNANASPHIPKEIERAVSHGVSVIPLRVEAVMPGKALDYFISSVHWLDAITPPLESHLESLATTILTLVPHDRRPPVPIVSQAVPQPVATIPPPTPLPTPIRKKTGIYVAVGVAVVLLAAGAFYFFSQSNQTEQPIVVNKYPTIPQSSNRPSGNGQSSNRQGANRPMASGLSDRDPIIGCWQWFNNVPVTINPDGRLVAGPFTARWQHARGRSYRFTWPEAVDAVTMSGDENSLSGGNQYGFPLSAVRVGPGVGIVGSWRWANGAIVLIRAEGTFTVGPFTGRWSATSRNTFNLTWPNPVDSVSLSSDSTRISGQNQYGIGISGTRTAASCGV